MQTYTNLIQYENKDLAVKITIILHLLLMYIFYLASFVVI